MKCPFCTQDNNQVIDSRPKKSGTEIWRRRKCHSCGKKFSTSEHIEKLQYRVIKRDGTRVPYDHDKLQRGLERACWKRKISDEQLSALLAEIEKDIESSYHKEVESQFIGERAMYYLSKLDQVAYVRFASVYQRFDSAEDFVKRIKDMRENVKNDDLFDI